NMNAQSDTSWAIGYELRPRLDRNVLAAHGLPGLHATSTFVDAVGAMTTGSLMEGRQNGMIGISQQSTRDDPAVYHTDGERFRWIHDNLERPSTIPCGHRGVRKLNDCEEYTCRHDGCDQVFAPDAAHVMIEGNPHRHRGDDAMFTGGDQ
ncbi:MAG: hypothetical protein ACOCTH_00335, partial [Halodesulfurarchaeum sp.]